MSSTLAAIWKKPLSGMSPVKNRTHASIGMIIVH